MSTTTTPQTAPVTQAIRRELPTQIREATLVPATWNEAERTIDVVWTTGARRRAYDYLEGTTYEEELVVSTDAVDMTRFEAGVVQVLDSHRVYGGIESIIGIAVRGWIDAGVGKATLRLSSRPELAGIVKDIQDGIIRSISFGYSVEQYEVTQAKARTDGGQIPLYRATKWTPQEISFVTVPADPGSSTRSAQSGPHGEGVPNPQSQGAPLRSGMPCEFIRAVDAHQPTSTSIREGNVMPATTVETAAPAADDAVAVAMQRAADITDLCQRHGVPTLAAGFIRAGHTIDQSKALILDELARRDAASGGHTNVRIETTRDEVQTRMSGMQEALMSRVDGKAKLTDNGRQYRGLSILEMGRELIEGFGQKTRGLDRMALATRILAFRSGNGMHTGSDFSSLLANVASKRLRDVYAESPGSYTTWARRAPNAPDFKSMNVVQLSAMPDLLRTNEAGEFKYGALTDGKETYSILTYGRVVSLSRQAIVNDDLRAFDRLIAGFGASAARLENRTVYAQLIGNPAMGDGTALFHTSHANLGVGAGSALSFAALSAGRSAMRKQTGLQGEALNIAPAYLIVPSDLEQTAYQFTSSQFVPAKAADVNEFRAGGRSALEPICEPLLDSDSATAWYLAASNGQIDTVEYCYLDGAEGPVVESEIGFEVDGVSFKCREDFAAKVIDHRGLYKGAGA